MNLNIRARKVHTYDAIVIGSGISGGWAAKELCQSGLKTLMVERGRNVEHINDYSTAALHPWEFEHHLNNSSKDKKNDPVKCTIYDESNKHFFVSDKEHPYIQEQPFLWKRGYQVGGRSLTWGRQCYRLSNLDFEANLKDGVAVDWPIRYEDLSPWYDYVESFIGISGQAENWPYLPDGIFQPPMELNCIEKHLAASIKNNNENRLLTIARVANLTQKKDGRGPCQYRNACSRGCPFGGYFSSNSSTIPAAIATGNLTLRPFAAASEIIVDGNSGKAIGVRITDTNTKEVIEFFSRIIFINASTINTTALLLNSKSSIFPNGFGNGSEQVGHNLMDHHSGNGATGVYEGLQEYYYKGRRPAGFYIPRFQNLPGAPALNFIRGYGIQGVGRRQEWQEKSGNIGGFGEDFKKQLTSPGPWTIWMSGWGECLPYYENRVTLDAEAKDSNGLPIIRINFTFKENEEKMMKHTRNSCAHMLEQAGFKNINTFDYKSPGGSTIHEMGTARMGRDPKTSVLNGFNQMHEASNVFITDGSCMTSSSSQNPSLTYMALTARACNYAVSELKKGNL